MSREPTAATRTPHCSADSIDQIVHNADAASAGEMNDDGSAHTCDNPGTMEPARTMNGDPGNGDQWERQRRRHIESGDG